MQMLTPQEMDIPGFPGYKMHIDGTVTNKHGHTLKYRVKSTGRVQVALFRDGRYFHICIAKLLKMTYFRGYDGCLTHRDGCRTNFSVWNMEKTTQSALHKKNCSGARPVCIVDRHGNEEYFRSESAAARELCMPRNTIKRYCDSQRLYNGCRFSHCEGNAGRRKTA